MKSRSSEESSPSRAARPAVGAVDKTAGTASPVTLDLYDPCGGIETPERHARRLDTLAGKTICELANGLWESERSFPVIRELLAKQFPDARIIPYTEFPIGTNQIELDKTSEMIKQRGCQAVIVGNAA